MPTDFIIRNERQCDSSKWIIDYWTVSVGAQASHYAYCWTHTAHVPLNSIHTHTNTEFPINPLHRELKIVCHFQPSALCSVVPATAAAYSRRGGVRGRFCTCVWVPVAARFHGSASESESDGFFYCRLEEGRKLARKGGRASAEKWVRHLRARRPFFFFFFFFCDGCQDIIQLRLLFFSLLSLLSHEWFSFSFFFPLSPPCQGKVQREERVIMLGMSAEDGL